MVLNRPTLFLAAMARPTARCLALALVNGLLELAGCHKNGQTRALRHPAGNAARRAVVTPDKACNATFNKLNEEHYLIIIKAERGRVFTVHTGPLPTTPSASPASGTKASGNARRNIATTSAKWPFRATKPAGGPLLCNYEF